MFLSFAMQELEKKCLICADSGTLRQPTCSIQFPGIVRRLTNSNSMSACQLVTAGIVVTTESDRRQVVGPVTAVLPRDLGLGAHARGIAIFHGANRRSSTLFHSAYIGNIRFDYFFTSATDKLFLTFASVRFVKWGTCSAILARATQTR